METKHCPRCNKNKPIDKFDHNGLANMGRDRVCKQCKNTSKSAKGRKLPNIR